MLCLTSLGVHVPCALLSLLTQLPGFALLECYRLCFVERCGRRAAVCVTHLDASLLERGVICSTGAGT